MNEAVRIKRVFLTDDIWLDVNDVKSILCPLANAITAIEGNEVDSRSSYKKIKEAFDLSKASVNNSEFLEPFKEEMLEILKKKKEFVRTDVAYLMDLLEPSDQGKSVDQENKQAAVEFLPNKSLKDPMFTGQEAKVMTEWAHRLAGTGAFAKDKQAFSMVAQMLHNIPISAAGLYEVELNGMNADKASQMTFIKHNLMLEHAHLFKPPIKEHQVEEEEVEEEANEEQIN